MCVCRGSHRKPIQPVKWNATQVKYIELFNWQLLYTEYKDSMGKCGLFLILSRAHIATQKCLLYVLCYRPAAVVTVEAIFNKFVQEPSPRSIQGR